jgi:cellobiose-specific phosphotransferase system component IIA
MPLTLEEVQSLVTSLGVQVSPNILAEKAKTEEFKTRLKEIMAQSGNKPEDWRLKGDFTGALHRATEAAKGKHFDAAFKVLDEAEEILRKPDAPPEPEPVAEPQGTVTQEAKGGSDGQFSIVELQKSRLAWDNLRKSVHAQLEKLEQSIIADVKAHNGDETAEDEFDETEVTAAVKKLYTILGEYDQQLMDKLDEALNAKTDEQRGAHHSEAAQIIKQYQAFVAGDSMLAVIDENGFTNSTIRKDVIGTLTELAGKFQPGKG